MKILGLFTAMALVLSLPLAAETGTGLTIDLSGFFLTRTAGTNAPLVSQEATAGTGDVFMTEDAALTAWKPAGELRVAYAWSKLGAEVRGFLTSKLSRSAAFTSTASVGLTIETDPVTFYGMPVGSTLTAGNESSGLKSFEANLTYALAPAVRLFGGFRYLKVNDAFELFGDFNGGSETDVWTAANTMVGGQVGARVDFVRPAEGASRGFTAQGRAALALLSNDAQADFTVLEWWDLISSTGTKLTPAVDAGLQVGYCLGRQVEFHVGYDLLWLGSVAQAVRHVARTTSYNSEPTLTLGFDSLVYHGAKAGVTVRF